MNRKEDGTELLTQQSPKPSIQVNMVTLQKRDDSYFPTGVPCIFCGCTGVLRSRYGRPLQPLVLRELR